MKKRQKGCSKCDDPGITQRAAMSTVSNLPRMWPGDPRQLKIWNMTLALDWLIHTMMNINI